MVEDTLREGTAGSGSSEGLGESEGLSDWEIGLDDKEGSSRNWLLTNNDTSSLGKGLIDTTHGIIGALNLAEEDWLDESWLSGKLGSIDDSSGSWDDLTTTSVDSVGMEGNVHNVELDTSHVLVSHDSLLGGPLESSFHGVLDFVKVLDSGGLVEEDVGT